MPASQSARRSRVGRLPRLDEAHAGGDLRRDQARVAHGVEAHEADAVREGVRGVGGDLHRQAGLARPAGTGQRHEAVLRQQPPGGGELAIAADERRQLRRQADPAARRASGPAGNSARSPSATSWYRCCGSGRSLSRCGAEVAEGDAAQRLARDERPRRVGHEDLTAVRHRRRSARHG